MNNLQDQIKSQCAEIFDELAKLSKQLQETKSEGAALSYKYQAAKHLGRYQALSELAKAMGKECPYIPKYKYINS